MLQRLYPSVAPAGWRRALKRAVARTPLGPWARDTWRIVRKLRGVAQPSPPPIILSPQIGPSTGPYYVLRWLDEGAYWRSDIVLHPRTPPARLARLKEASPLMFNIIAPAVRLSSLALRVTASAVGEIECAIHGPDGALLLRQIITVSPGSARDSVALDLSAVRFRPGGKYKVSLVWCGLGGRPEVEVFDHAGAPSYEVKHVVEAFSLERLFAERAAVSVGAPTCFFLFDPDATEASAALELVRDATPGLIVSAIGWMAREKIWKTLKDADIVLMGRMPHVARDEFDALCFALHRRGVCTIFVEAHPLVSANATGDLRRRLDEIRAERRRCQYSLLNGPVLIEAVRDAAAEPHDAGRAPLSAANAAALVAAGRARRTPHVAIVSVLYAKADVIETFLEHATNQTYPGRISVVLVDDHSPQDDSAKAAAFAATLSGSRASNRDIHLLRNDRNSGNCASRLNGLSAVDADIYVVIDCDCLINRDFVAAHVFEHWFDDVDVVIGPLNIESWKRDPAALVESLSANPGLIAAEADVQDPIQRDGFLNCITRNFSVKARRVRTEPLFDEDFAYSARPDTGFGWEDVEMGYRLYSKGTVIRYTEKAFAVHCTHSSSASEQVKAAGSMRNFLRLFQKHPDLALAARRWVCATYGKIIDWADRVEVTRNPTREALERVLTTPTTMLTPLIAACRPGARRLRVLSFRWHTPHQYELYKLPHDFTLVTGLGNPMADAWSYEQRPLRENVCFRPVGDIDPKQFDVAILHFDENVFAPQLCNGVIPSFWGDCFSWLLAQDLPKAAICHGTPQFEGQYGLDPNRKAHFEVYEDERARLVEALKDVEVVCNSYQALSEWRFKKSRVIWHGFDPQEFPFGAHDGGVLATEADFHRPHYRGAWEHLHVESLLDPGIVLGSARHAGAPIEIRGTNAFATRHFRSYVDRIGRFKAYLNTTLRSPMPRARGEAMMTGVIPVCLRNHDVDRFIEQNVDGFYADKPEELADFINYLFRNDQLRAQMALAARRKAMDVFNHDRYLLAWTQLLKDVVN